MLKVENLTLSYGHHLALQQVSLRLETGETVSILGANGSGKTTLLKAIMGLAKPLAGKVLFNDVNLIELQTHEIVELGIVLVPEGRRLVGPLSVYENLKLGAYARRARETERKKLEYVFDLFPRLAERRRQTVKTMSGGEQQMVAIGRALMANPKVLLLDEPSLGLAPRLVEDVFAVLHRIAREGSISILLVEQNARQALSMSERGYILATGKIIGSGESKSLREDPMVANSYLGL